MTITLDNLGRRFNKEWIFRGISKTIDPQHPTVIFGNNGSGKSTLLKLISSSEIPSEGSIQYQIGDNVIPEDQVFSYIGMATPYMDLPEEFTLSELLQFNLKFKPFIDGLGIKDIAEIAYLSDSFNKQVKVFSSGMKQRLKLALAFYTENAIVLLDEPTSNLDQKGIDWYQTQLKNINSNKTLVICSNAREEEHFVCNQIIDINQYK